MSILMMSLPEDVAFSPAFRMEGGCRESISHHVCMQDLFSKKQTQTQAPARGLKSDCCDFKSEGKKLLRKENKNPTACCSSCSFRSCGK